MKLKVVDDKMGAGKTSMAIKMMREAQPNISFCYITPFLNEIDRVIDAVGRNIDGDDGRHLVQPLNYGDGKLNSFKKLLIENKDIASTHALFKDIDDETRELLRINNYVLILDEVLDVLEYIKITSDDVSILIDKNFISIDSDGVVSRNEDVPYSGKFAKILAIAANGRLLYDENKLLIWCFPYDIFNLFSDAYIMTYMFSASLMHPYFELYGVGYEYLSIDYDTHELIPYREPVLGMYKDLVTIIDNHKINNIGDGKFELSLAWYSIKDAERRNARLLQMKNNIYNYFKHISCAKSKEFVWTTFKDYQSKLVGNGYRTSKSFCQHNMRATNAYAHKTVLAYTVNRFTNPYMVKFFARRGIKINQEITALSEMLQWIFRSAIREDKKITIYIPSRRMRELLIGWLK